MRIAINVLLVITRVSFQPDFVLSFSGLRVGLREKKCVPSHAFYALFQPDWDLAAADGLIYQCSRCRRVTFLTELSPQTLNPKPFRSPFQGFSNCAKVLQRACMDVVANS